MRRLVAAQRDLQGETSQSDWSEDDEGREGETTDDGGLDHHSMAANGGLTDAEGAMSGKKYCLNLQIYQNIYNFQMLIQCMNVEKQAEKQTWMTQASLPELPPGYLTLIRSTPQSPCMECKLSEWWFRA